MYIQEDDLKLNDWQFSQRKYLPYETKLRLTTRIREWHYNWKKYPIAKQVARIGNSVVPIMAEKLVEANCPYLKVGERMPNMSIDDSQEQLRFA